MVGIFRLTESFFVRYSSEYEILDNDRKVNGNILPDAGTRDMMNNSSSWPYDWPIKRIGAITAVWYSIWCGWPVQRGNDSPCGR